MGKRRGWVVLADRQQPFWQRGNENAEGKERKVPVEVIDFFGCKKKEGRGVSKAKEDKERGAVRQEKTERRERLKNMRRRREPEGKAGEENVEGTREMREIMHKKERRKGGRQTRGGLGLCAVVRDDKWWLQYPGLMVTERGEASKRVFLPFSKAKLVMAWLACTGTSIHGRVFSLCRLLSNNAHCTHAYTD